MNENELGMTDNLFQNIEDVPLNPVIHVKWLFKNGTTAYLSHRTGNHVKYGVMEWSRWLCSIRTIIQDPDYKHTKDPIPFLTEDIHGDYFVIAMEEIDWVEVTDGQARFTFMF